MHQIKHKEQAVDPHRALGDFREITNDGLAPEPERMGTKARFMYAYIRLGVIQLSTD